MNFLDFLEFILIFLRNFYRFNSLEKGQKGVIFSRWNRGLMWRGVGHVAEPREPTQTLARRGRMGGPQESTRTPRWCLRG